MPSLKFVGLTVLKMWLIFRHSVNLIGDLDLSTSKRGHGSLVSWASFLLILSLLGYSVLDFGSGTGQTDLQTDR